MKVSDMLIIAGAAFCIVLGLFSPLWPLVPAGVALLVLYGHTTWGLLIALTADLLYGPPAGALALVHFPFFIFAVACVGLRALALSFILPRGRADTL